MSTFTYTRTLRAVDCCHIGCGVVFGIDSGYDDHLRKTHEGFIVRMGIVNITAASRTVEKARETAEWEKRQREWAEERNRRLMADLISANHKVAAERGAKTKLKRRIAHGVCPCCKRYSSSITSARLCRDTHFKTARVGHALALHWRNESSATFQPSFPNNIATT